MNSKVFQIYYRQDQIQHLDPAFTPYDNTANPNPDLNEWLIWNKVHQESTDGLDYWGFTSWKFKDKMAIPGQAMLDHIAANPGYDVYLFNPAIINEAVFANGWEQGDYYHPGLSSIANTFLSKVGYKDYDVTTVLLDRTRMSFATYFVANRKFWNGYMELSNKIFTEAENDSAFKEQLFAEGSANYNLNKKTSYFPFLNERLVGTYMDLGEFKVCPYQYTLETAPAKYNDIFADISALSDLKMLINQYESDELYSIWNHFRQSFMKHNPSALSLE
jgi:hypothetical protein